MTGFSFRANLAREKRSRKMHSYMKTNLGPALAILLFLLRSLEMRFRRSQIPGKVAARGTLTAMIAAGVCVLGSGLWEHAAHHRPTSPGLLLLGGAAATLSFLVRGLAARALGDYWSMQIELRQKQPLLQTGIYGVVRHPIYLAAIFEVLAICLLCDAPWTLLVGTATVGPALWVRISLEERALTAHFGELYVSYKNSVPALVPGWKSLRGRRPA
jgi:protein-S-isoprenylcysteine O-methyltransferase Ste14